MLMLNLNRINFVVVVVISVVAVVVRCAMLNHHSFDGYFRTEPHAKNVEFAL
jgi:hypothetical protein